MFFPDFFLYFIAILHLAQPTFHIWKCALDPENTTTNSKHHPISFSWFFPVFYCYFTFSTASLSIFGNVHYTLKTPLPTVSTMAWLLWLWEYKRKRRKFPKKEREKEEKEGFPVQWYFLFIKMPEIYLGSASNSKFINSKYMSKGALMVKANYHLQLGP